VTGDEVEEYWSRFVSDAFIGLLWFPVELEHTNRDNQALVIVTCPKGKNDRTAHCSIVDDHSKTLSYCPKRNNSIYELRVRQHRLVLSTTLAIQRAMCTLPSRVCGSSSLANYCYDLKFDVPNGIVTLLLLTTQSLVNSSSLAFLLGGGGAPC
jgi:hypothetical protein